MDKPRPSRKRHLCPVWTCLIAVALIEAPAAFAAVTLSQAEALQIGKKVWQNECNGTVAGLTSWNEGENFASLGIGHFIWYPKGARGPFDESFPKLIAFASSRGVQLPKLLADAATSPCPWNSRTEFVRAQSSPRMKELRQFLTGTIDLQAQFLVDRLEHALPKMLSETRMPQHVRDQFDRVATERNGLYALIDYVNFKGEGTLATERYRGEGWGLLQVLEAMRPGVDEKATKEFSRAAGVVLKRRVANSPPARHEARWLPGWLNRVNSYNRS